jgi:nucleoside-diphosphate-sugar epimerase
MVQALPDLPRDDLDRVHAVVGARWEALRGQRLFLTGGTGFIGKWLLASLLDADRRFGLGCQVTVLTRNPDAFRTQAPGLATAAPVELLRGDVRDFRAPLGRFDLVVHAATDVAVTASPLDTFDTCVQGTRRVFEVAAQAGARRVLLVSSGAVYGRQPPELPAVPEDFAGAPDTLAPSTAYGQGKRAAEWLATSLAASHGLEVVTARCFAFVGPYLPLEAQFAIGNFLRDALAGRPLTIQGDGTPLRSYLHAADMAGWLWALLVDGKARTAYNVGGDESVSIALLAQRVVAAVASSSTVKVLKTPAAGLAAERYVPDVARIRRELQLAEPLGLDAALRRTAAWYRPS